MPSSVEALVAEMVEKAREAVYSVGESTAIQAENERRWMLKALEGAGVPALAEENERLRRLLAAARSADACAEPWSNGFKADVDNALASDSNTPTPTKGSE